MANRKHFVLIQTKYISVKDWMRDNKPMFQHIKGTPTSQQIGTVLKRIGYTQTMTDTEVIYKK